MRWPPKSRMNASPFFMMRVASEVMGASVSIRHSSGAPGSATARTRRSGSCSVSMSCGRRDSANSAQRCTGLPATAGSITMVCDFACSGFSTAPITAPALTANSRSRRFMVPPSAGMCTVFGGVQLRFLFESGDIVHLNTLVAELCFDSIISLVGTTVAAESRGQQRHRNLRVKRARRNDHG